MTGRIHSIESFGTVDGPGVRMVVFFQGCPMRCRYCHNPDTWEADGGREMTVEEILSQFESNRPFYQKGGLTATGGEPMLQLEFLTELFEKAKTRGIHTCLDTSGVTFKEGQSTFLSSLDRLLDSTDLVLLDIKHIDAQQHKRLSGYPNDNILQFARFLDKKQIPVWIRHVVVPGITTDTAALFQLGRFIGSLCNVKALDVLPYHDMGKQKYESLGMDYPLKELPSLTEAEAVEAKHIILRGIRERRAEENL